MTSSVACRRGEPTSCLSWRSSCCSRLDIKQILSEAQHRWLRPAEIGEILRNYQKFHIFPEAPNKPVSKKLAGFDIERGWVSEAERVMISLVTYWISLVTLSSSKCMPELVESVTWTYFGGSVFLFDRKVLRYFRKDGHNWRKKKDGKTIKEAHEKLKVGSVDMLHCYYAHGEDNEYFQRRSYWLLEQDLMHIVFVHYLEVKGNKKNISLVRSSDTVASNSGDNCLLSSSFHRTSPNSTLSSAYEDAELEPPMEDNQQASSRFHSYPESPPTDESHYVQSSLYNQLSSPGDQSVSSLNYSQAHTDRDLGGSNFISGAQATVGLASWQELLQNSSAGEIAYKQESGGSLPAHVNWQHSFEDRSLHSPAMNQNLILNLPRDHGSNLFEDKSFPRNQENFVEPFYTLPDEQKEQSEQRDLQMQLSDAETGNAMSPNMENFMSEIGNESHPFFMKKPLFSGLQKDESLKKVDSFSRWIANELGESGELNLQSSDGISWSIMGSEYDSSMPATLQVDADTLNPSISQDQLFSIIDFSPNWAYADLETKVLIIEPFSRANKSYQNADGQLCLAKWRLQLRLACSEIREFEYRFEPHHIGAIDAYGDSATVMYLYQRFETILSLGPIGSRLKEKFYSWLLHGVTEDGKGLTVVDEGGQGVLHLAAALGFNWALQPIIVSGISINLRDVKGWTALHWAAFYGREDTVAALVYLGAFPGALTDPSAEYPWSRTPADLASSSGHKGISGFLAETSLTTHFSTLRVSDPQEGGISDDISGVKAVQTVSERLAFPTTGEDVPNTLCRAALCNATQAAANIHQIFRIQSFQRKQFIEHGDDELLIHDEHAIAVIAAKTSKGVANAAAVHIQKKFRAYPYSTDFSSFGAKRLTLGASSQEKTVLWSVGILEKAILRWRRKRFGLCGFQPDAVLKGPNTEGTLSQEDDYDFLKEGRKQTEGRMQKALARVKSMAQYPEARAQYRRLLTAAEGFRETKDASDVIPDSIEDVIYTEDDLIYIESLLDDDTFMSLAFE
ncbi:hypothetical protein DH2020_011094 [Rehmannia glutinosa]|uniref:CG-1 domain-containing protein n=1 Tax=Rehmannia glutinosa TaxID=99300 RepID=A0ABR0XCI7_REHGL